MSLSRSDAETTDGRWVRERHLDSYVPPTVIRVGAPVVALAVIAATVAAVFLAPDGAGLGFDARPATDVGPVGIGLVVASGIPWTLGLWWGEFGPDTSEWFPVVVLAPVATVGIGGWFIGALDLGSFVAYQMLGFSILLIAVLYVAGAPHPAEAVVVAGGAYGILAGSMAAGWLRTPEAEVEATIAWHVAFAFSVAAAYAVRRALIANMEASEAREALAWQAVAEERRRVARDVHDVVAHTLAVTMLHVTAARMAVRRSATREAEEALEEAERHGRASLADVRRIVRLLRSDDSMPTDAPQPSLADVPDLVNGYRAAGLPVELTLAETTERVSPVSELAVYRALQEALANAARHGTGPATVAVRVADDEIVLSVDNPITPTAAAPVGGSGMLGMRERISAAGGSLDVGPETGHWVVRARVPLDGSDQSSPGDLTHPTASQPDGSVTHGSSQTEPPGAPHSDARQASGLDVDDSPRTSLDEAAPDAAGLSNQVDGSAQARTETRATEAP